MKARAAKLTSGQSAGGLIVAYPGANKDAAAAVDARTQTSKRAPDLKNAQSSKMVVEKDRAVGGSIGRPKRTLPASSVAGKSKVAQGTGSPRAENEPLRSSEGKRTRSALGAVSSGG